MTDSLESKARELLMASAHAGMATHLSPGAISAVVAGMRWVAEECAQIAGKKASGSSWPWAVGAHQMGVEIRARFLNNAGVAQSAEHSVRNQAVEGSTPSLSSTQQEAPETAAGQDADRDHPRRDSGAGLGSSSDAPPAVFPPPGFDLDALERAARTAHELDQSPPLRVSLERDGWADEWIEFLIVAPPSVVLALAARIRALELERESLRQEVMQANADKAHEVDELRTRLLEEHEGNPGRVDARQWERQCHEAEQNLAAARSELDEARAKAEALEDYAEHRSPCGVYKGRTDEMIARGESWPCTCGLSALSAARESTHG